MVWKPSRANRAGRTAPPTGMWGRALRGGASLVVAIGLLFFAAACGQNVQTNRPYTPAEGVNIDVGNPATPNMVVHVRNLAIISWGPGEGVLSGSIVTADRDSLSAVSGDAIQGRRKRGSSVHWHYSEYGFGREWPTGRANGPAADHRQEPRHHARP